MVMLEMVMMLITPKRRLTTTWSRQCPRVLSVSPRSGRLAVTKSLKVRSFGQMSITWLGIIHIEDGHVYQYEDDDDCYLQDAQNECLGKNINDRSPDHLLLCKRGKRTINDTFGRCCKTIHEKRPKKWTFFESGSEWVIGPRVSLAQKEVERMLPVLCL